MPIVPLLAIQFGREELPVDRVLDDGKCASSWRYGVSETDMVLIVIYR
jgi:hypothetical protein